MPEFVIEREMPGAHLMTEAELHQASLKSLDVLDQLGPDIKWLRSYVTEDKIYCVYFAPDEGLIRKHASLLGVPANRVAAVRRLIDPAAIR